MGVKGSKTCAIIKVYELLCYFETGHVRAVTESGHSILTRTIFKDFLKQIQMTLLWNPVRNATQ